MTPTELVLQHYRLPFDLRQFQIEDTNTLSVLPRSGLYLEPGLGKTAVSTCCALYKLIIGEASRVMVIMPPLLIVQWARWLNSIEAIDGSKFKILRYEGDVKHRAKLSFDADFILLGIQIFKIDKERILKEANDLDIFVILDEAQCVKDVGSGNYQAYRHYIETQYVSDDAVFNALLEPENCKKHQLLTGTPLNFPEDSYAYIKLVTPHIYRNLLHFHNEHVVSFDVRNKPKEYKNLDVLKANLVLNASRRTKEEVLSELPECVVGEIEYELDSKHYALYKELADSKMLLLPGGDKIDATNASALYYALGQIVCQWSHFGRNEKLKAKIYSLIEEVLGELGDKKLIVFSNFRRTNEEVVRRFGFPGIWGEIPDKEKARGLAKFLDDPKCRGIAMHPSSGGVGVDGFQHVCTDILYTEPPVTPAHWVQSLSRVHRSGQAKSVTVRMGVAKGTIQRHLINRLSEKEALVNPVQGSESYLTREQVRKIVFGLE